MSWNPCEVPLKSPKPEGSPNCWMAPGWKSKMAPGFSFDCRSIAGPTPFWISPPFCGFASKGGKLSCRSPNSRKVEKSSSGPVTMGDQVVDCIEAVELDFILKGPWVD